MRKAKRREPKPRDEYAINPVAELEAADKKAEADKIDVNREMDIQRLRDRNNALTAKNRALTAELLRYREVRQAIEEMPEITRRSYQKRKPGVAKGDGAAIAQWGDWHYANEFKASAVEGVQSFGPDEANRRCAVLPPHTAKLYGFYLGLCDIDEFIIALLGDFVHGYIHEEQLAGNSMGPMEEIIAVRDHLVSAIEYLYETIKPKRMRIAGTAGGNHARTTKRNWHVNAHTVNHEWMLYAMVARGVKAPVEWELSDDYFNTIDVKGRLVRLHHGHDVRYLGGVGGVMVPLNRKIGQWNKVRRVSLDMLLHFHQFKRQFDAVIGPPLVGFDPYALSIGADYEPPGQALSVVDRHRGLVFSESVHLT